MAASAAPPSPFITHCIVTNALQENCFLFADATTRDAVVIDPGGAVEEIVAWLAARQLRVHQIINTHGHIDHIAANVPLRRALLEAGLAADAAALPIFVHAADAEMLRSPRLSGAAWLQMPFEPHTADHLYAEGDLIGGPATASTLALRVLHTPGHSPGSCILIHEASQQVFVGDLVFAGSIGRTDLPGGDEQVMYESLREKLLPLPDALTLHPGHGPSTTLARERARNPYLLELR